MTNIAWKNLARQKMRLAISVGGVAFSVLLILVLRGLYSGITEQATEYIRSVEADLWVAEAGTPGDFFHATSFLPEESPDVIDALDGVEEVAALVGTQVVFEVNGQTVDFRLLGVDPGSWLGGPARLDQGTLEPGPGQIVLDRVFANNAGIRLGDRFDVRGVSFEVAGIARGGNAFITQFAWARMEDVINMVGLEGAVNYVIVRTESEASVADVARRIEQGPLGAQAFTEEEFAANNIADIEEGFVPIIGVLVAIALVIGVAVIGLTIYTATMEKAPEYGVLKALGFSNRRLYGIVTRQSLTAGVLGFVVGTLLTFVLTFGLERLVPVFITSIGPVDVALAGVAALLMAVVSSFIPIRPVARLDPAAVFRA